MYKLRALAYVALICAVTGCTLDSIPDRGNKCPPAPSDETKLAYIIQKDGSMCDIGDCPEEYAESFSIGFCPIEISECYQNANNDYYCMTKCPLDQAACDNKCVESSNPEYCGAQGNCNDNQRGANYKGEKCKSDEICKDGECKKAPCTNGKICDDHCTDINVDPQNCGACGNQCQIGEYCDHGNCKNSTSVCKENECSYQNSCVNVPEHCGTGCADCTEIENVEVDGTSCSSNGECFVTHCVEGYHIAKDKQSCIKNTLQECGLQDSTDVVDCTNIKLDDVQCVSGKCESKCGENSHEYEGQCEPDDKDHCGEHGIACKYDKGTGKCVNKVCQLEDCEKGYHIYGDICESDNNDNCGEHDKACVNVIEHGSGLCNDDGQCIAQNCNTGYHVYNGVCETDDNSNCGVHGKSCPQGAVCIEKECYAESCSADTNALLCTDKKSVCRIRARYGDYLCQRLSDSNESCFKNENGTIGNCESYRKQNRGVTGKCIYDESKMNDETNRWQTYGWICECKNATHVFSLDIAADKYFCKEPN